MKLPMLTKHIDISKKLKFVSNGILDVIYDKYENKPMILILPGGGYHHLSPREAEPVANKFLEFGYNVAILKYSVSPFQNPTQLIEVEYALKYLHRKFKNIFVMGFSAGGHLVLSNACYYKEYGYDSKPDGLILCYPVVSTAPGIAHDLSFKLLLDDDLNEASLDKLSLEKHISNDLPPVFLWHCFTDESVPVTNSLVLLNSLKKYNIKTECHIFSEGVHGMSLSDETTGILDSRKNNPYVSRWFLMCIDWLKHNFS